MPRTRLPQEALESPAGLENVKFIRPAEEMMTNGHARRAAALKLTRAERAARLREQLRRALPFVTNQKAPANISAFNSTNRTRANISIPPIIFFGLNLMTASF